MKNQNMFERVAKAMDLSNEPVPGKPLIEIVGSRSVLVENHCGVLSYSKEQVSVKTKNGCISISGSNLILTKMSKEQLRVCGNICKVELFGRN